MAINIEGLSKRLGGSLVLDNVTLSVPEGEVVGLAGPNGSGKTMLMRAVAGLIRPTEGFVEVGGKRLWRDAAFPSSMGILIENPAFLSSRTGMQNLCLLETIRNHAPFNQRKEAKAKAQACSRKALERVGLDPADPRKYRKYSLGMKQRLGIAAVIVGHPKVLLLDEPANALDESGVDLLRAIIAEERSRGTAVLLSCHDRELMNELADRVCLMAEGRITREWRPGEEGKQ